MHFYPHHIGDFQREDRLDEIREKTREFKEQLEKTNSLWRKRKALEKDNG